MKKFLFISLFLGQLAFGQSDSLQKKWSLYGAGAGYMNGLSQFFEGYNHDILIANSSSGLPLYGDWDLYTRFSTQPAFYQVGAWLMLANKNPTSRLRFNLTYTSRSDTLQYQSAFERNDTIFGRYAVENSQIYSVGVSFIKSTKLFANFFRLYAGAEGDFGIGPRTKIDFQEYSYDTGDMQIVEINAFPTVGNPRLNMYVSALLGMEVCFLQHFGVSAELRSGFGGHLVVNEPFFGMSKTVYVLGLGYYFKGY